MRSLTVRDRSSGSADVQVWKVTDEVRLGIRVIDRETGEIVGAFLPITQARRLIRAMTQICNELEQEKNDASKTAADAAEKIDPINPNPNPEEEI